MSKTSKQTLVHKLEVSDMSIDEVMAAVQKTIHGFREDGWHFASHTTVTTWTYEQGGNKQYILCTFCK